MKTIYNMIMVYNKETEEVLVLDKVKKYGWEGLTFPGGHVEEGESFKQSAKRELYEETGLVSHDLELRGILSWVQVDDYSNRDVAFLYYTDNYKGELLEKSPEGELMWVKLEEFPFMDDMSLSMKEILQLYLEDYSEAILFFNENRIVESRFY